MLSQNHKTTGMAMTDIFQQLFDFILPYALGKACSPQVIVIMGDWLGSCHLMLPVVNRLKGKYLNQIPIQVVIIKEFETDKIEKLNIIRLPAYIFVANCQVENYVTGVMPISQLEQPLLEFIDKWQPAQKV